MTWWMVRRPEGGPGWLLGWVLILVCASAQSATPFILPEPERVAVERFSEHVDLLQDAEGKLGIDDVSREPISSRFVPATLDSANVGFTTSVYWVRFTLRNEGDVERPMFVRQTYPLIDYVELYEEEPSGEWLQHATGDRRPFGDRPVAHRDLIFPLSLPAHAERTFYLRYQSQGPIDISLSLFSSTELLEALSREQTAYGIYYGAVIMLLVWAALVFIASRDNAFLAYIAYVGTFGLYMLVHNGLAYQYLWPDSPRWGNTSLIVLLGLALVAGLQFSRMILRAKDYIPRLDLGARGLQAIALLFVAATPFLSYAQLISPIAGLILLSVIFMLTMGVISALSGSRPATYYVVAWSSFLAGSVVYLLKIFGFLPHTFFTQNGWQIGSLLEMVLLSLTLSSRMNELQHQSRTDPLTLLGNRRLFDDKLAHEFALARHLRRPLALLVLDIDNFKHYNDRHGHMQGDEAIKAVASAIRKHVRKPFVPCRYGGEEFTIILPGTDGAAAALLADRLRTTVESALSGDLGVTISVGYAALSQTDFESADKLFDAADSALYSAKQQGRNRVVAFRERRGEDTQSLKIDTAANG